MKYNVTSTSGPVKGNNPFILSRMTVSNEFKHGQNIQGLIGYDAQGNMITSDPNNPSRAGYEPSGHAMYNSNEAYPHSHTALQPNVSINQMHPQMQQQMFQQPQQMQQQMQMQQPQQMQQQMFQQPQQMQQQMFQQPQQMQQQMQMPPKLTAQTLEKISNQHNKTYIGSTKKSKHKTHQLQPQPQLQPPQQTQQIVTPTVYVPQIPAYDQITSYSQYTDQGQWQGQGIVNPTLLHRNNQLSQFRKVDQANNSVPVSTEWGPNGDYQKQMLHAQAQSTGSLNNMFSEPKMDNGLWYKHQAGPKAPLSVPAGQNNQLGYNSYDKWETGSMLDEAFAEPKK